MKKALMTLFAGLVLGAFAAVQAKLPPPTDAEKKAAAEKKAKDEAGKAKTKAETDKAEDRAVANYKRNRAGAQQHQATKK
jgi:hypothetical protein